MDGGRTINILTNMFVLEWEVEGRLDSKEDCFGALNKPRMVRASLCSICAW